MPLNIRDVEDSFLMGKSEFELWRIQFEARWNLPDSLLMMGAALQDAGMAGLINNPEAILRTEKLLNRLIGKE